MLEGKPNFLIMSKDQFLLDAKYYGKIITLVVKDKTKEASPEPPLSIWPLLEKFSDVVPQELVVGLPPMHDIQHIIDLILGNCLSNLPYCRMSQNEHKILQDQVKDLLRKGLI